MSLFARRLGTSSVKKQSPKRQANTAFRLEALESRVLFAADLGIVDDLAALNDEFENSETLSAWHRVHEVENWNADQLQTWDIDQTQPGRMVMQPHTVVWYQDWRGPMAFKEVTGDFIFTTEVHISDRDDLGGSDADDVPGEAQYSLGGLMIRTPRDIVDPAVDWAPGSGLDDGTNNGENYVFLSLGYGVGANEFSLEVKTTRNSNSQLELTPVGSSTAKLRIARVGDSIITLYQLPGQEWQVHRRFTRSDMPDTLQLGLVTYSDWGKASDFDPFVHNSSVLTGETVADPTPYEPFNPDLTVGFEYARYARPQLPDSLVGVDLVNGASDEQLLSFLGDAIDQAAADGVEAVLDSIGDVAMSQGEGSAIVNLPATLLDGSSIAYAASVVPSTEYQLDQQHDFYSEGDYHDNWGGQNERWIRGDGDAWFYILQDGAIHQWSGSFETSLLLAQLDASIHADPTLLMDVELPALVSTAGNQLLIDPSTGFVGSFEVDVNVYLAGEGSPAGTKRITVAVSNAAPVVDAIADQVMSRIDDNLYVAFSVSDPDGDALEIDARVVQSLSYELNQQFHFYSDGNYADNWGGQNERWIRGDGDGWFYLLPTGDLYRWTGGFDSTQLVGSLGSDVYDDPTLLTEAQATPVALTVIGNELIIDPASQFVGSFTVVVSASDGVETTTTQFQVTVNDTELTLDPIRDLTFAAGAGPVQTEVTASSSAVGPDLLNYSVEVVASQAERLDAELDLLVAADFHTNWGGQQEKWLQASNGAWFYILPDGGFYRWNNSFGDSPLLGTFDASYYQNPNLIADPQSLPVTATMTVNILTVDAAAGFTGSFEIAVSVTDGLNTVSQIVSVTVSGQGTQAAEPLPVLLVIANQDFYYREYADTRVSLEAAGLQVVVAAATMDAAWPHFNTGEGADGGVVQPDVTLFNVSASDYSTIVFIGGWGSSAYQYAFEGTYDHGAYNGSTELKNAVNQLINDFVDQDKYVTAICHGVSVLAWARVDGVSPLEGRTVSAWGGASPSVGGVMDLTRTDIEANGATMVASGSVGDPTTIADDVIVDGRIITAENYDSAARFGEVIAEHVTDPTYLAHLDELFSNWEN